MSRVHLHRTTTVTPGQYAAGLRGLGPSRSKPLGNSADAYLKVHHGGRSQAGVTEGSGGIWERPHYDWSGPNREALKATDSSVSGGPSGHTDASTCQPGSALLKPEIFHEKNGCLDRACASDVRIDQENTVLPDV